MNRYTRTSAPSSLRLRQIASLGVLAVTTLGVGSALAATYPVTPAQRSAAKQVAEAGVPLSELAPNAPDSHTVKRGDTLWDISKLFLKSPWRWPELWGMNLEQIRNPHLIYPGQMLYLDKSGGRARLRMGQAVEGDGSKLKPRVRSSALDDGAIASIPLNLIGPFLNEAVVFNNDELAAAPRIVAAQEGRVIMSRGDLAYVRGELGTLREYRVFRETTPLTDPVTNQVLGYEATFLGTADYSRPGESRNGADGKAQLVPATFTVTSNKQEISVGDRLAPVPMRDFDNFVPHAPSSPMSGQIISVYGESLAAGQNQIVALNRGAKDGMERGHVLGLWRDGTVQIDKTDPARAQIKLPDEKTGTLFVFRVFDRVSYALIITSQDAARRGDRFTQP